MLNPENFQGFFLFGSVEIENMHRLQRFTIKQRNYKGELETYKICGCTFSYVVNHGNNYYTLNTWHIGQVVPHMLDITNEQLQQLKRLSL